MSTNVNIRLANIIQSNSNDDEVLSNVDKIISETNQKPIEYLNLVNDDIKSTPLMLASLHRRVDMIKRLVSAGADADVKDKNSWSALFYAIAYFFAPLDATEKNRREKTIETLLELAKDDVNLRDSEGRSLLIWSVYYDDLSTTKLLIERGADVNIGDIRGNTPLMITRHTYLSELLITNGANIYHRNYDGRSVLDHVYESGNFKLAKEICRKYLEQIFRYFFDSAPDKIEADLSDFIETGQNQKLFAIKDYLKALDVLLEMTSITKNDLCSTGYFDQFDFLPYFVGYEFQVKLWHDVINKFVDEKSGELLTKSIDKDRVKESRIEKQRKFIGGFQSSIAKLTPMILNMSNKLFSTQFENVFSDEFNRLLEQHLSKFRYQIAS